MRERRQAAPFFKYPLAGCEKTFRRAVDGRTRKGRKNVRVSLCEDRHSIQAYFDRQEITWRDWFSLDEYWTDESPFAKGGGVEFDCFPLSSTIY